MKYLIAAILTVVMLVSIYGYTDACDHGKYRYHVYAPMVIK